MVPSPSPTRPEELRNVVLVGHSGSGKTTLFEHLVAAAVPEHRPRPTDDERSIQMAVASVATNGVVLNLIDTPGYPDFVGELRAGLRAADAALFVVSASDGVDAATRALWQECAAVGTPRAVVVTKLDVARADIEGTVARCREAFGDLVLPLYLPVRSGPAVDRRPRAADPAGLPLGRRRAGPRPAGPEHEAVLEAHRGPLIEAIIQESEDDTLMERYLGGEEVGARHRHRRPAERRSPAARFYPVVPVVAPPPGSGSASCCTCSPPRSRRRRCTRCRRDDRPPVGALAAAACDPDGPLVAEVVRTTTDPYVGRVSLVRVFSGTLRPDTAVHVSGHLAGFAGHERRGPRRP